MLLQATSGVPRSAHVIVLGNEKGGSGKSTTAMHIAVSLLKAGQRVATIDLDSRQKTFTRYFENRRESAKRTGAPLELPEHYCIARGEGARVDENEAAEFSGFAAAINEVEHACDFVVVDTPGNDTYLMRLAHSMADTLVTPLNDSFLDFDVLGTVDAASFEVTGIGHYARMVRYARRQRRMVDGGLRTGSWCGTGLRCSARATRKWWANVSTGWGCGSASARLKALPSAWCSASSSRWG